MITAKQLIKQLQQLDPKTLMLHSSDSEGNRFSPLYEVATGMCYDKKTGETANMSDFISEGEKIPKRFKPVATLWPS